MPRRARGFSLARLAALLRYYYPLLVSGIGDFAQTSRGSFLYDTHRRWKRAKMKTNLNMERGSDPFDESVLDKAIRFQNGLVAHATGGGFDGGDPEYQEL